MGIFGNKKNRGSIVGNYNTIGQAPRKKNNIQEQFDTFGGTQFKGDLMSQYGDNITTTTTVTTTKYIDPKTGQVRRTTTTKKKSSRAGSLVSFQNDPHRASSLTAAKPHVGSRASSMVSKKKYRYVSSSTGLKLVEITPEDEQLEREKQQRLVRRSNSHVSLRPSSMYTPQKKQPPTVAASRQSSLNNDVTNTARKNWAKIERASSGLAAAQVVTGNKEIRHLTNTDLRQRKSLLNMKSTINSPSRAPVKKMETENIREESPEQPAKDKKTVKRVPSMREGLAVKRTPTRDSPSETLLALTKPVKKDIKITPMKVKVKPSLGNLKEKDENFLRFQKDAVVEPASTEPGDAPAKDSDRSTSTVNKADDTLKDTSREQTATETASNADMHTLKEEDVVPQGALLEEVTADKVPAVAIPVHKEMDIVEPFDGATKEKHADEGEVFSAHLPPVIELDTSDNSPAKKLRSNPKNFDSSESVFYSANEDNDVALEPVVKNERPLKSAIRTKSKYATPSDPVAKRKATSDAHVKLTTAENTRLNSQLQDENQRQSRIVRSPSKRVSLKISPAGQHPSALSKGSLRASSTSSASPSLKRGKMKMSERMNGQAPAPGTGIATKPIMNVKLEAPDLTPLERKSSFERERGEKKAGFGMMSMRHDMDEDGDTEVHMGEIDTAPKFKSRFVDSDDEYPPEPQGKRNSTRLMTNATTLERQAIPEKKKGLGSKLKKMFGKSKRI